MKAQWNGFTEREAGDKQSWSFLITCIFSLQRHIPVRQTWKLPANGQILCSFQQQSLQSCHGLLYHAACGQPGRLGLVTKEQGECFSRPRDFLHICRVPGCHVLLESCFQTASGVSKLTPVRLLAFMQLINSSLWQETTVMCAAHPNWQAKFSK